MIQKVHSPVDASQTTFLFANSSPDSTEMIAHLRDEAAKYGLKMHLGRTKILSNVPPGERQESLTVGTTSIDVLREGVAERNLGKKLTPGQLSVQLAGLRSRSTRLRCAIKSAINRLRMKLFESTVTFAVLFGSSCWTMWVDTERLLRTNSRRMLRLIMGVRRRPSKIWVECMQRLFGAAKRSL